MWRPYPAREAAADIVERAMHTGTPRVVTQFDIAQHDRVLEPAMQNVSLQATPSMCCQHAIRLARRSCTAVSIQHLAGGEQYLETADHELTWLQSSMLDVYACVAAAVLGVLGLLGWGLLYLVVRVQRLLGRRSSSANGKASFDVKPKVQ